MTEPLKLVHSDKDDDEDDTIAERVKRVDELVDELIAANAALKEEMEKIRLTLGLDRYDFDRLKSDDIWKAVASSEVMRDLDKIELKLRKELDYE